MLTVFIELTQTLKLGIKMKMSSSPLRPDEEFYMSETKLQMVFLLLLIFEACFVAGIYFVSNRFIVLVCVIAAAIVGFALVRIANQATESSRVPVISVQAEKIVFRNLLCKEIEFSDIKAVSLLGPASRGLGYTLSIELKSQTEGNQKSYPVISIPLFNINVEPSYLLSLIQSRIT